MSTVLIDRFPDAAANPGAPGYAAYVQAEIDWLWQRVAEGRTREAAGGIPNPVEPSVPFQSHESETEEAA